MHGESWRQSPWTLSTNHESPWHISWKSATWFVLRTFMICVRDFVGNLSRTLSLSRRNGIWALDCIWEWWIVVVWTSGLRWNSKVKQSLREKKRLLQMVQCITCNKLSPRQFCSNKQYEILVYVTKWLILRTWICTENEWTFSRHLIPTAATCNT